MDSLKESPWNTTSASRPTRGNQETRDLLKERMSGLSCHRRSQACLLDLPKTTKRGSWNRATPNGDKCDGIVASAFSSCRTTKKTTRTNGSSLELTRAHTETSQQKDKKITQVRQHLPHSRTPRIHSLRKECAPSTSSNSAYSTRRPPQMPVTSSAARTSSHMRRRAKKRTQKKKSPRARTSPPPGRTPSRPAPALRAAPSKSPWHTENKKNSRERM